MAAICWPRSSCPPTTPASPIPITGPAGGTSPRSGAAYQAGEPIPDVEYTAEEDDVWRTVSSELAGQHRAHACHEYRLGAERLVLATERVPQLREVDAHVHALTGFHIRPVPGLVPTRDFYGALADRTFLSTQYVRHHSVPFYTPEPDLVHEIIGHANMLASPTFADLYMEAGRASRRTTSDEAMEFFSKVFWFTLEFGVVWEDDDLKAYGAGLLSSYGELCAYRSAEVRPWDLHRWGLWPTTSRATSLCSTRRHPTARWSRTSGGSSAPTTRTGTTVTPRPTGASTALEHRKDSHDRRQHLDHRATRRFSDTALAPAARLLGWDCLELWVGNARTTAGFLLSAFGFTCTAYAGPETGVRHKASYVLEQGDIRLVVSAALAADSPIAAHVRAHGDGVHDLAWLVDDARAAYEAAVARGATAVRPPWEETRRAGRAGPGADRDVRGHRAHLRGPPPLHRPSPRAWLRGRPPAADADRPAGRLGGDRPRGRQRRAGPAGRLGTVLRRRPRLRSDCSTSPKVRSRRSTRRWSPP